MIVDAVAIKEIVKIVNDNFVLNTETDWVAISALVMSIITLIWQGKLRKQDRLEQLERAKKEDAIRKWNALYPHRLQFFTDFYDLLFRFINYTGSSVECIHQSSARVTKTRVERTIKVSDITEFCSLFNKFDEEAKILFNKNIQHDIHTIYELVNNFVKRPIETEDKSLSDYYMILDNNVRFSEYLQIEEQLHIVQEKVRDIKLEISLRNNFKKSMQLKEYTDE